MIEWLLSRTTIIGLAVLGGVCSLLGSWLASRNLISEDYVVWLNRAAYTFMGVSVTLFIGAGMFGSGN